ncbi:ribonuclease R [Gottschalkia acidurici 9a]|uniref:Ribonuclease R n=1 Tax=Gottschalkia acidurici (strain ATCC 7906 / DSM 604 / BCRC 14475 / CIP 104303 / KCTC 5404 / NCIMB 10678 / 9a) TaxID=1128398 RepID=K0AZH3_GOTA9|nr:ribonuclease R [Gottschalkia acidurici]AFS78110.1 ribonuclease R [Gottschalkia acidurici 9a]
MIIKDKILEFMREVAYKPMSREELAHKFDIDREQRKDFYKVLEQMEKEGSILRTKTNVYGIPERMNLIVGTLQGNRRGYGFLIPDNKEIDDVFISAQDLNGALHGDKIIVRVTMQGPDAKSKEGEVIRILERVNETIVGTYESSRNFGFVVPSDNRINMDIFISKTETNGAKTGEIVEVEITKWPEKRRNPEGRIINIIGHKDDAGTDILTIIKQHGLPEEFPYEVMMESDEIVEEIPEKEIARRLDLRKERTFTIDGPDAKDFDDAVSIEKLENGNYKLGVHIADVTYYVRERSALDKEALTRGTSVYLVDRVIPMLPEKISNGVCSLRPNEDRLTLSVIMEVDSRGKVVDQKIAETVISSSERLIYDDVSDILEKDDVELKEKYKHILTDLKHMEDLCEILINKRKSRGSIDFDFPESRIILDEKGKPIDITKYDRRISNRIIEEFMLISNETIAEYMYWTEIPFLYRVHEDPDMDRINEFNKFISNFGYHLKGTQEVHPKELQSLVNKIKGKPEEIVISTLMLRSLKKARYSADIDGHFGLAAEYYSHFTAPIRRYPDLQIHRIIKEFINGKITDKRISTLKKILPEVADITSKMERRADEAERDTDDLKKVEFMMDKIGEEYEGFVSGAVPSGFFVELDNTVEGFVHISSLIDDYYNYNEQIYGFMGERTKQIYKLGDRVKIKVLKANIANKRVEFALVRESSEEEE